MPIRYAEIGASGGAEIVLPAAVLRSSAIAIPGSGPGRVATDRLVAAVDGVGWRRCRPG